MAGCSWARGGERFVVGREVGDVLHVEQQLLIDEAGARQLLAHAQGVVIADVLAQIRQEDFVAADRGAAVVVGGIADGVEALLDPDHVASIVEQSGVADGVGFVVAGQRGQHQCVVGDGLGAVGLSGGFRGGASAECGEEAQAEEHGDGAEGPDRNDGRHVAREAHPRRGDDPAASIRWIATGVRCFSCEAWRIAESGTRQCAIGHGTPSLVFLRSGGVY